MHRVVVHLRHPPPPAARLELHEAIAAAAARRGGLIAFGWWGAELRLLLHGPGFDTAARRIASLRGWPATDAWSAAGRDAVLDVAWAHALGIGPPLARPWTSHRDHLRLRHAGWVRPLSREQAAAVHRAVGGGGLPRAVPPPGPIDGAAMRRAAAATLGRLAPDRRCRPLTAQLALALGHDTIDAACISGLCPRRVRQLRGQREPRLRAALATLADPRLAVPLAAAGSVGNWRRPDMERGTEAHARARTR